MIKIFSIRSMINSAGNFTGTIFSFFTMHFAEIINILQIVFLGLAASISLQAFTRSFPIQFKILSIAWILVFAVEIAGHIIRLMHMRNHWLYNVRDPFLYLALTYIYQQQLQNRHIQKFIRAFYIIFPIFVIINSHFIQGVKSWQSLTFVVGGSFIIFLAGAYFWQLYKSNETEKITKDPFFWFSFGFLLYFGCALPFLGMINYLWQISNEFTTFYYTYILNVFSILLNILILVGFLCRKNYQKLS